LSQIFPVYKKSKSGINFDNGMAELSQNSNFPQKLFALMESEHSDVVCWTDRGLSFRVVNPEKFAEDVVPKYFRRKEYITCLNSSQLVMFALDTKMTSFQRQLNLYGFRRVTKGEDTGSYFHPKFQRDRRDLISEIKRLPGKAPLSHDQKIAAAIEASGGKGRYNPNASNIVEVFDPTGLKSVPVSRLTANINGLQPIKSAASSTSMEPPTSNGASNGTSPRVYPQTILPAFVKHGAVQFVPVSGLAHLPIPGISLLRENMTDQPPLLLRNFSVSSTFDEEYRLSSGEDAVFRPGGDSNPIDEETSAVQSYSRTSSRSDGTAPNDIGGKPAPPVREESESWVKLAGLDSELGDPFNIDDVFE
jgi:hypothetical protein